MKEEDFQNWEDSVKQSKQNLQKDFEIRQKFDENEQTIKNLIVQERIDDNLYRKQIQGQNLSFLTKQKFLVGKNLNTYTSKYEKLKKLQSSQSSLHRVFHFQKSEHNELEIIYQNHSLRSLKDYLNDIEEGKSKKFSEEQIIEFLIQMLQVLEELRKLDLYFYVITPEDILYDYQKENNIQIYILTDLFRNLIDNENQQLNTDKKFFKYMGFELRNISRLIQDEDEETEIDYDKEKISVFNLGLISIQLLNGYKQLPIINSQQKMEKFKLEYEKIQNLLLKKTLEGMILFDETNRFNFSQCLQSLQESSFENIKSIDLDFKNDYHSLDDQQYTKIINQSIDQAKYLIQGINKNKQYLMIEKIFHDEQQERLFRQQIINQNLMNQNIVNIVDVYEKEIYSSQTYKYKVYYTVLDTNGKTLREIFKQQQLTESDILNLIDRYLEYLIFLDCNQIEYNQLSLDDIFWDDLSLRPRFINPSLALKEQQMQRVNKQLKQMNENESIQNKNILEVINHFEMMNNLSRSQKVIILMLEIINQGNVKILDREFIESVRDINSEYSDNFRYFIQFLLSQAKSLNTLELRAQLWNIMLKCNLKCNVQQKSKQKQSRYLIIKYIFICKFRTQIQMKDLKISREQDHQIYKSERNVTKILTRNYQDSQGFSNLVSNNSKTLVELELDFRQNKIDSFQINKFLLLNMVNLKINHFLKRKQTIFINLFLKC